MTAFTMTVVAVEQKTANSKTGKPYKFVEIAYKNVSYQNKLESFKVNQYSPVFSQAAGMQPGQTYSIDREKDAAGYNQWMKIEQQAPGSAVVSNSAIIQTPFNPTVSGAKAAYAEQDAKKQIYIVKQSAVKAAVDLLSIGAKTPPSTQSVLEQAQKFVDYVFEDKPLTIDDMTKLPNDIEIEVE